MSKFISIPKESKGFQYENKRGNTITIIGDNNLTGDKKKLEYTCTLCSKDKELFKENFYCYRRTLEKGGVSCGCSPRTQWSEQQQEVRVKRKCIEKGYKFISWVGTFKGSHTRLLLENPATGNEWKPTIHDFINGNTGDPDEKRRKLKELKYKGDTYHIKAFKQRNTLFKDCLFWKGEEKRLWYMYCPSCANDVISRNNIGSAIFKTDSDTLKTGGTPCRCSKSYKNTRDELEWKVKTILREEGHSCLGFKDRKHTTVKDYYLWRCNSCFSMRKSSCSNILSNSYGCTCRNISNCNGFYPQKVEEKDYLYLLTFRLKDLRILKVGRSFSPEVRVKRFKGKLLRLFTGKHKEVWGAEQKLHQTLDHLHIKDLPDFSGRTECFSINVLSEIEGILDQRVPTLTEIKLTKT